MVKPPLILVVDDETHIVNVLSVKLRGAGFRVASALDGREAIRLALDDPPDLVITDVSMPGLDGRGVCDALLQFERTRHKPVILLTGRGHTIIGEDRRNIRATIAKPFSPREVLNKVNELLNIQADGEETKAS